ncbi:MAG: signal peptidase II [Candidatus Sericytochromatia bacterium]|nr:signal peptidase II [Candidatus Sericytochromatia bacterium]
MLRSLAAKRWFFLVLSLIIFALDQATKYPFRDFAEKTYYSKPVLPFLSFTYLRNTGSLFGIFQDHAFLLGLVSLSVAIGICWFVWQQPKNAGLLPFVTLGFLMGGAVGNMYDRLFRGYVIDFLDLQWQGQNIWPVFNVADIAVDVAIGLFVLMAFLEPKESASPTPEVSSERNKTPGLSPQTEASEEVESESVVESLANPKSQDSAL